MLNTPFCKKKKKNQHTNEEIMKTTYLQFESNAHKCTQLTPAGHSATSTGTLQSSMVGSQNACKTTTKVLGHNSEQTCNQSLSWPSSSPCWNRHLQTSYTWGWTAGSRWVLCVYRLITPPSYHSLRSTHGSFHPQSLKDREILFEAFLKNTKNFLKNLKIQRKMTWNHVTSMIKISFSTNNRQFFLPIITNWESGVNDASNVTPLLLL